MAGVLKSSNICGDLDVAAVPGRGRLERVREIFLPPLFMADLGFAKVCHLLPRRIQTKGAFAAIQDHWRAVGELESPRLNAGKRGNSQRARQDRHVRGCATTHRRKTHHLAALHRGGVRWCQILGDENGIGRVGGRFPFDSGEKFQHALADIAQIVGALGEQLVAQTGEPVSVGLNGVFPGEGSTLPLRNSGGGNVDQIGILEELGMRRENGGFRLLLVAMQLSAQRFELSGCLIQGIVEQAPLLVRPAALFLHLNIHMTDLVDFPYRQTRGRRHSDDEIWINLLLGRWCGDRRCIHGRQRGGWHAALISSPSAIIGVSFSNASFASGPLATKTTLSPSAISTATMSYCARWRNGRRAGGGCRS